MPGSAGCVLCVLPQAGKGCLDGASRPGSLPVLINCPPACPPMLCRACGGLPFEAAFAKATPPAVSRIARR